MSTPKDLQRTPGDVRRTPTGSSAPEAAVPITERIRRAVAQFQGNSGGGVPRTSALLLDISGSMHATLGANVRAIDELRKLASGFTDVRRFQFHSHCEELRPGALIDEPIGGTALHVALGHVKANGVSHVVLITDGHPDDANAALRAAHGLRIDCFYVGPDPAPPFLAKLCGATGGTYGKASLQALKELGQAVRGLLPAGSGGTIHL